MEQILQVCVFRSAAWVSSSYKCACPISYSRKQANHEERKRGRILIISTYLVYCHTHCVLDKEESHPHVAEDKEGEEMRRFQLKQVPRALARGLTWLPWRTYAKIAER